MCVEGVCDGAMEVKIDTNSSTVGGHYSCVHLHLFFRVTIFRLFVPCVFVSVTFPNATKTKFYTFSNVFSYAGEEGKKLAEKDRKGKEMEFVLR